HAVITWFFLHSGRWELPPSRFIVHAGQTSVALFFMITSFLFWGRILEARERFSWANFFIARFFRLYPVFLVMLGLVVLLSLVVGEYRRVYGSVIDSALIWTTMLATPDINGVTQSWRMVAGVTWTLSYEWFFYFSLPFFGYIFAKTQRAGLAAFSFIICLALAHYHGFSHSVLQSFMGGIIAAHLVRRPGIQGIASRRGAGLLALSALASVVYFSPTAYSVPATIGLTIFFVCVAAGSDIYGILRRPALVWLGEITYSLYLIHGLFLYTFFEFLFPSISHYPMLYVFFSALMTIAIVVVSTLSFLLIEEPCIRFGRKLQSQIFGKNFAGAT
ncbi:MAG: acyltransferase, partial [Paracoccaceae bacterium]|nr:acyltransferase [Paracoccaceae bacterium]